MADLAEAIESLGKMIGDKFTDKFEMGTVIRWVAAGRYAYAALKTPVGWATTSRTGNPYVARSLTFEDLAKVLRRAEVTNIEVASAWKPLGPQTPMVFADGTYVEPKSSAPWDDPRTEARSYYDRDEREDNYPGLSGESI